MEMLVFQKKLFCKTKRLVRLLIVASGLYWVSATTAIDHALYLVALAAVVYGVGVAAGLREGPWRPEAAAR